MSRIYEHFNGGGIWVCPLCHTADDKQSILVGVDGTGEGNKEEALLIHLDCVIQTLRVAQVHRRAFMLHASFPTPFPIDPMQPGV